MHSGYKNCVSFTNIHISIYKVAFGLTKWHLAFQLTCSDVISAIKASKEFDKQNEKIIMLYKNAEREIKASQARLEMLIQKENDDLLKAVSSGMDKIAIGIMNGSYEDIELGLADISGKFGLSLELLQKDKITRNNLFDENAEAIVFD